MTDVRCNALLRLPPRRAREGKMKWLRLYTEIRSDRKIRRLTPGQRWVWITLLCLARESPEPGKLLYSPGIPITLRDLADESCVELRIIKNSVSVFISQNMLTLNGDQTYTLVNWSKRQYESDNVTLRTRAFKQKERSQNVPGTPPDNRVQNTEVQKNIKELKASSFPNQNEVASPHLSKKKPTKKTSPNGESFNQFWKAYPRKVEKKGAIRAFARINPDDGLLSTILSAIERSKTSRDWTEEDGHFIPYPTSWLNGRRWEDEGVEDLRPAIVSVPIQPSAESDLRDYRTEKEVDPVALEASRERLKTIFRDLGQAKAMPG